MKKDHYTKLRNSIIIGYVDSYGAVHSHRHYCDDDKMFDDVPTHEDLWGKILKGWRWDYDRGLDWSVFAKNLDEGDGDLVKEHLTRKYRIPFYENGYHDIEFFMKKLKEEREGM